MTLLAGGAALAGTATGHASPYTEVASAFDEDDRFDLHVSLSYGFESRHATVKREFAGLPGALADEQLPIVKDLVYNGTRHTIVPRLTLGVFTDVEASLELPIVVADSRRLEFDQRAEPCVFPNAMGDEPTCINEMNSTTVQDGLLGPTGFDSNDPTGPGFTDNDDPTIFRGPDRSGLDQLRLGLAWAPMNQARDDTKPTWKVGAELRLAIGGVMSFDRTDPASSTGVGRGLHEVKLWTSMAKRVTWAEPFFEMWWQASIGEKGDSHFIDLGFGQQRGEPQQQAGTRFGFAAIAWENVPAKQRVDLDFSARLGAHFEGRDYSEMWEVFQYAGDADAGGPLVLDEDPIAAGQQARSHPGVSNIENYLTFAAKFGVNVAIGERVRFGAAYELLHDQSHLISFADAGVDLPTCEGGGSDCETDDNDIVNSGTREVSPVHVPLIDVTGHRYRLDEVTENNFFVYGVVLF